MDTNDIAAQVADSFKEHRTYLVSPYAVDGRIWYRLYRTTFKADGEHRESVRDFRTRTLAHNAGKAWAEYRA